MKKREVERAKVAPGCCNRGWSAPRVRDQANIAGVTHWSVTFQIE